MKNTGLLIAAAVLAALTGTLYWSDHHKTADTSASAVAAPPKMLALKDTDVSKIEIQKTGAERVVVVKNDAGKWQITAPTPLSTDQDAVSGAGQRINAFPNRAGRVTAFQGNRGDEQVRERMEHNVGQAGKLAVRSLMLGLPALKACQ